MPAREKGYIVEKTLAKNGVIKRNLAVVNVNYLMSHDTTTPLAIEAFEAFDNFKEKIIRRNKVIIVFGHIVPPSSPNAAFNQSKIKILCRSKEVFVIGRAWALPDNVSTNHITRERFNITADPKELRRHVFRYVRPEFADNFRVGDVIVGGKNFCGSSREQAALVLKECGDHLVAESYGWIFKRNCVNLGVLPLETKTLTIKDGNNVEIDISNMTFLDIIAKRSYRFRDLRRRLFSFWISVEQED